MITLAETKAKGPAAPAIEMIPVGAIEPHPDNQRTFREHDEDDLGLVELAESIRAVGLLEPVLVRPVSESQGLEGTTGERHGTYQLVAGERRWRACRLAGLEELPAIVRQLDDREALEVMIAENMQREDLHPIEEARGVQVLMAKAGWSAKDVADRLGRSLSWVAQRVRLTTLSERWMALVTDPGHPVSEWPIGHLVEIARLEPAAQDLVLEDLKHAVRGPGIPDRDWIAGSVARLIMELRRAAWGLDDDALHPDAGSCTACHKRSGCHPGLFDDDQENPAKTDRCLDRTCWDEKLRRHVAAREAELRAKHPDLVLLRKDTNPHEGDGTLYTYQVNTAKKNTPGARPAMLVDGPGAGKVQWVTVHAYAERELGRSRRTADGEKKPAPLADRRISLDRRRKAKAVEAIRAALEAIEPYPQRDGVVDLEVLIPLVGVFGTYTKRDSSQWDQQLYREQLSGKNAEEFDRFGYVAGSSVARETNPQTAWKLYAQAQRDSETLYTRLWHEVRRVLLARLVYQGTPTDIRKLWADAEAVSKVLGIDSAAALEAAIAALPDPKSWASLKPDGTPKKKAAPKAEAAPKKQAEKTPGVDEMSPTSVKVTTKKKRVRRAKAGERSCRVCGCTDLRACDGGCHWVGPDLCSRCADEEQAEEAS